MSGFEPQESPQLFAQPDSAGAPASRQTPGKPPPLPVSEEPTAVHWPAPVAPPEEAPVRPARPRRSWTILVLVTLLVLLTALIFAIVLSEQWGPGIIAFLQHNSQPPVAWRIEQLRSDEADDNHRRKAAAAITKEGPEAVLTALDACATYSADNDAYSMPKPIFKAWAEVGRPLVPALRQAIASDKENVRIAAVQVLSGMGKNAAEAVEDLGRLVNDPNRFVRNFACEALANVGLAAAPAVAALTAVVRHADPFTRRRAILALSRIGPAAKPALPAIKAAAQVEKVHEVRDAIDAALFELDLESIAAEYAGQALLEVRQLIQKVLKSDERQAIAAIGALGQMGPQAREAVPALALALRHRSRSVRTAAAQALGQVAVNVRIVVPVLERVADDDLEPDVRDAAAQALERIGAQ